jgi:hypothetical protein
MRRHNQGRNRQTSCPSYQSVYRQCAVVVCLSASSFETVNNNKTHKGCLAVPWKVWKQTLHFVVWAACLLVACHDESSSVRKKGAYSIGFQLGSRSSIGSLLLCDFTLMNCFSSLFVSYVPARQKASLRFHHPL